MSEEESTQEIELDALRDSIERALAKQRGEVRETENERETSRVRVDQGRPPLESVPIIVEEEEEEEAEARVPADSVELADVADVEEVEESEGRLPVAPAVYDPEDPYAEDEYTDGGYATSGAYDPERTAYATDQGYVEQAYAGAYAREEREEEEAYREETPYAEGAPYAEDLTPYGQHTYDPHPANDPTPSFVGTLPGHDVAQALRAMMGEVADEASPVSDPAPSSAAPPWAGNALDDGDTQTRMPDDPLPGSDDPEEDALPAFALDEDEAAEPESTAITRTSAVAQREWSRWQRDDHEGTGLTRGAETPLGGMPASEITGRFDAPIPASARPSERPGSSDELVDSSRSFGSEAARSAARAESSPGFGIDLDGHLLDARANVPAARLFEERDPDLDTVDHGSNLSPEPFPAAAPFPDPEALPEPDLPRFTMASIPEGYDLGPAAEPAEPPPGWRAQREPEGEDATRASPFLSHPHEDAGSPLVAAPSWDAARTDDPDDEPSLQTSPGTPLAEITAAVRGSLPSVDIRISAPDPDEVGSHDHGEHADHGDHAIGMKRADLRRHMPSEVEIEELLPDEVESGPVTANPAHDLRAVSLVPVTSVEPAPEAPPKKPGVFYPPAPPPAAPPAFLVDADAEERELIAERRFGPLIAIYRQRLGLTESPTRQAVLLLKIASVYETGMENADEAWSTLVEAFETAPLNEDVVAAVDRLGRVYGRIGELADRVKRRLLPGAPDDKRVPYLAHLVYWYEKVLSRGSEASALVSDIERQDKVHPIVLKRAAQLAAMNGDVKLQREHLVRALERTIRREERVALYLALASAYGGTPEMIRWYEAVLEIEPTSIVAIQGVKRLGIEKEVYSQVQWALERQAEVAPTDAERIDALLELAEIQETKFLKREEAAELLEKVLLFEPSHPQALKGLERCYHALRDWPKLARVFTIRADHTFDQKSKVDLLLLAAEVYESKIGDAASAIEVYTNLVILEPKHRRALSDLARLYEKSSDWPNVATYRAKIAELAMSKRSSSQELVKLGDFLSAPDRAPSLAKEQYERAVEIDPTNAAAWEAIQKIAAAEGDEAKVIDCLEQRKKHTDVPRQRAVVLVELARVHRAAGDEDAAMKCFEAAIRADSSNEPAAVAMLDAYTAEERWAEAAPLCELLVNAAVRDRDGEALFVRLRLATRIAAALGDVERSTTSALAALDARPKDPGAQADLIAVCAQAGPAKERARAHLQLVAENADDLAADMMIQLAALLRDQGDLDLAAATFERARRLVPDDQNVIKDLSEVYLAQADFPRACKLKMDLARNAGSDEARFEILIEVGEIWARRADELEMAATIFEEARAIKRADTWLLETLLWLYGELGEWETLTGVLEDIAETQEKDDDKVKTYLAIADIVRDKLDDRARAADLYDRILDLDRKRLDIFEELVRALTEQKNWERLERSYRKMIARVKDDDESQLQFLLFHQLGLIYRDRLGDASRAFDALDAASRLRPDDADVRKIVVELLVVTDNLDNAVLRLRDEIDRNPHDTTLYPELYELFLRQHSFDKAWCVVNVLCRVREPTPEQRRFHEDYSPMPLDRIPGQIVEQAWRSHVFHADLDPALTSLFALMTPAVARMRFGQLRPEQRVGRPFTPTHSRMQDSIRATFNNASEILGLPAPDLLLGDPKAVVPFSPALAPFGAVSVCVPQIEAQSKALVYLVGKRLAEQRPELAARGFFPAVADLTSLAGTAIRVSRQETAKDPTGAALDASFASILTPQERDGIRNIVVQATSENALLDVKKWFYAADISSMRAGLLLCGDVEQARQSILAETPTPQDMTAQQKIGELYRFATSDLYSDLRGAIGVAVQA